MAEASKPLSILVTGGAEGVGLAATRALLQRGHQVAATTSNSEGALALRMAGALPIFPDLARPSEILSALQMTKASAVVHAAPQCFGGAPHVSAEYADRAHQLIEQSAALVDAAQAHGLERLVSLSFGYLYEGGLGAAKEGARDTHDSDYAPMLAAESLIRESRLQGCILRSAYIYGGNSPSTAALADSIKGSRRLPAGDLPASWIQEDDLAAAIVLLLEAKAGADGVDIINAAANAATPEEFGAALSRALGLNEPAYAGAGFFSRLREQTLRDKLLQREIIIDSSQIRAQFGWQPRHEQLESGLEATALVWRMKDAAQAEAFYGYEDAAAAAIAAFAYDVALPEPVAAEAPAAAEASAAPEPAPAKASPAPASDGPSPWNEDDAKREERRRRALERKAKRAAKSARG